MIQIDFHLLWGIQSSNFISILFQVYWASPCILYLLGRKQGLFFFLCWVLSLGVGSQTWSAHAMFPPPTWFFPMWLLLMTTWRRFINNTVNFAAFSPWAWHSFFLPFQPPILWAREKLGSSLEKKKEVVGKFGSKDSWPKWRVLTLS